MPSNSETKASPFTAVGVGTVKEIEEALVEWKQYGPTKIVLSAATRAVLRNVILASDCPLHFAISLRLITPPPLLKYYNTTRFGMLAIEVDDTMPEGKWRLSA